MQHSHYNLVISLCMCVCVSVCVSFLMHIDAGEKMSD